MGNSIHIRHIGKINILLRAKDVQEIFKISRSTLNSWIRQGILQNYKKVGKLLYFDSEEIEKLADVKRG